MCRRKLSAVILKSRRRRAAPSAAAQTTRTKTSCCVSVGVNARKSCSPTSSAADACERVLVERPRPPERAPRLERRALARAAAAGSGTCARGPRSGRGSRPAPPRRRRRRRRPAARRSAPRQPARRRARPRRRRSRPGRSRGRRCRSGRRPRARPSAGRRASSAVAQLALDGALARLRAPSRGTRCRRTRASAAASLDVELEPVARRVRGRARPERALRAPRALPELAAPPARSARRRPSASRADAASRRPRTAGGARDHQMNTIVSRMSISAATITATRPHGLGSKTTASTMATIVSMARPPRAAPSRASSASSPSSASRSSRRRSSITSGCAARSAPACRTACSARAMRSRRASSARASSTLFSTIAITRLSDEEAAHQDEADEVHPRRTASTPARSASTSFHPSEGQQLEQRQERGADVPEARRVVVAEAAVHPSIPYRYSRKNVEHRDARERRDARAPARRARRASPGSTDSRPGDAQQPRQAPSSVTLFRTNGTYASPTTSSRRRSNRAEYRCGRPAAGEQPDGDLDGEAAPGRRRSGRRSARRSRRPAVVRLERRARRRWRLIAVTTAAERGRVDCRAHAPVERSHRLRSLARPAGRARLRHGASATLGRARAALGPRRERWLARWGRPPGPQEPVPWSASRTGRSRRATPAARPRVVVDELEVDHVGGVALARAELDDPRVAAGPLREARRDVGEQLVHDVLRAQLGERLAPRVRGRRACRA